MRGRSIMYCLAKLVSSYFPIPLARILALGDKRSGKRQLALSSHYRGARIPDANGFPTSPSHHQPQIMIRLLNVDDFHLSSFSLPTAPPYAILSHTWGADEVNHQDLLQYENFPYHTHGWSKLEGCCRKAASAGYAWVWIDTCNIDKTSSSELSEAINSMFKWYSAAAVCYVFLDDLGSPQDQPVSSQDLARCKWFTRGWTLQELLAPSDVEFCDPDWNTFGTKVSLRRELSTITRIGEDILQDRNLISVQSISTRMSWAADRVTSRTEDVAYALLGLFGVNMALLYGEGSKSFQRLQEAIIQRSEDQTVFAWHQSQYSEALPLRESHRFSPSILADHPDHFKVSSALKPIEVGMELEPASITPRGLRLNAPLLRGSHGYDALFVLAVQGMVEDQLLAVPLNQVGKQSNRFYRSTNFALVYVSSDEATRAETHTIYIDVTGNIVPLNGLSYGVTLCSYPSRMLGFVKGWSGSLAVDPECDRLFLTRVQTLVPRQMLNFQAPGEIGIFEYVWSQQSLHCGSRVWVIFQLLLGKQSRYLVEPADQPICAMEAWDVKDLLEEKLDIWPTHSSSQEDYDQLEMLQQPLSYLRVELKWESLLNARTCNVNVYMS